MFTATEKKYLALTLVFLAAGSGIKAYRHSRLRMGPEEDVRFSGSADSLLAHKDSAGAPGDSRLPAEADSLRGMADAPPPDSPVDSVRDSSSSRSHGFGHPQSHAGLPGGKGDSRGRAGPSRKADFSGKVSLNRASPSELTAIRGIGEKTAQTIVQYRTEHGAFKDLRELLQVKGIGEKKLEKIIPFLIL